MDKDDSLAYRTDPPCILWFPPWNLHQRKKKKKKKERTEQAKSKSKKQNKKKTASLRLSTQANILPITTAAMIVTSNNNRVTDIDLRYIFLQKISYILLPTTGYSKCHIKVAKAISHKTCLFNHFLWALVSQRLGVVYYTGTRSSCLNHIGTTHFPTTYFALYQDQFKFKSIYRLLCCITSNIRLHYGGGDQCGKQSGWSGYNVIARGESE